MALTILDDSMSSDRSPHTARRAPHMSSLWEVSSLPGRYLGRNDAITAMVLADATASGDVHPGDRLWPHIWGWAAELRLTASDAVTKAASPPRWADKEELWEFIEDWERISLDHDEDVHMLPCEAGWRDDPPGKPSSWGIPHHARDPQPEPDGPAAPQPSPEPEKLADWEAGQ